MVTSLGRFFSLVGATLFLASCGCRQDSFGEQLELVIPIEVKPEQDSFRLGDTLWISADFSKNVEVRGQEKKIYLENFNFFASLVVSEISDTVERYIPNPTFVVRKGELEVLPLQTAISYPMYFVETETAYQFEAGIVLKVPGLFHLGISSSESVLERYEHPAMYACKNDRRSQVQIYYQNSVTNEERYERLFLQTEVDYLLELVDFQRYSDYGGFTFIVTE
ncbi:hypothetical protein [Phaeodactylibacter xiamenensis]|jgi:hypothetical protein|uniref:hypothetical protein n=1 Tax=Phaeodactylibacter xiamenensis TaxID=1524460 RepID=UPI003CCBE314